MRVAWQGVVAIGVITLAVGAFVVWNAQSEMSYIKSCASVVACGTEKSPQPQFFLPSSLAASLQQAQVEWIAGIVLVGAGTFNVIYGIYLHPERRAEKAVAEPMAASVPQGAAQ